ncbi:MAG: GNAT family N-acetyltransferase [Bdellovibrionales bacterium]
MAALNNQKPRWGLILIDGIEAGCVQIMEAGLLKNMIHALILDRGPLWFDGFGDKAHIEAFFHEISRKFPQRWGRKRRVIAETDHDISHLGFQPHGGHYETIWLDVTKPEDALRESLKKNWRGSLNKAENLNYKIEWDSKGELLPWLIQNYAVDKETKGYDGPSVKLLKTLAKYSVPRGDFLIGRASLGAKQVAGILILCHGNAATYQIGFTSPEGRDNGAHHLLLWQALGVLKFKKIRDFDLGGINDDTAKGVKRFKSGMGGEAVKISGIYN